MGLGTGFIIRDDGLIVTNNHVIAGADIINVQLSEGSKETYEATLVGRDERTDIALIKIKPKEKLPVAVLGSSKDLEVGEWVAAFGNPFGHGHSMTKGIVSSKGRDITEINKFPLIQTDASINPGNSGGPLVNTKGLVVGVNSAIDARAQGIGFAIPIDEVKAIIPQLESKGRIARGYLGLFLGDLDPEAAEYLGLGDQRGAVVTQMDPRSSNGMTSIGNILKICRQRSRLSGSAARSFSKD
jgi:serine protease Do